MYRNKAQVQFELIDPAGACGWHKETRKHHLRYMKSNERQERREAGLRREGERPREPHSRHTESLPKRHKPASGVFVHPSQPTIVLLNVCTHQRHPWLTQPAVHESLKQVWGEALAWLVGRYVLMPDHLHLFCAPGVRPAPLDRWVSYWKRLFTLRADNPGWRWQVKHWDTRLRSSESYEQKWQYVLQNPVRKGLVTRLEDWPYQGELNLLRW